MIKKINFHIDKEDIAAEWDCIVEERYEEIRQGKDMSLIHILVPNIIKRVENIIGDFHNKVVVDCGCGSGFITYAVAKYCSRIIGIDISQKSIEIANKDNTDNSNIGFLHMDIEDFAKSKRETADICIANMLLSNVLDCNETCKAMFDILKNEGHLIATIPHPCFWSEYWKYAEEGWFDYTKEIVMSCDFKITNIGSLGVSTHIHRPLESYINSICKSGFAIQGIYELYSAEYKGTNDFNKPRFMLIECLKKSN